MSTTLQTEAFSLEEIDDLAEKCVNFTELLCFAPPATGFYPYQRKFAHAICKDVVADLGNTLTGLFSRQSGKSETVANTAAALMIILPKLANMKDPETNRFVFPQFRKFVRGYYVGIFSPSTTQSSTTYKRLRDRLTSRNGKEIVDSPEFALEGKSSLLNGGKFPSNSTTYLELNNGSFCLMMSADKQSNIESKTFHLILLDESQDLDEYVVGKSIMPMGAATNATTVATGTPGITKGYFYNMIKTNQSEELDRRRPDRQVQPQLHFEYNYKTVQRYNPFYKKYVLKEKKKIGEDSDEFQMAYNLKWLLERGMAVPEELFEKLTIKSKDIQVSHTATELVAGLDFGKGQDSTVLTIGKPDWSQMDENGRCPVEVIYWWEKLGDNYEQIFAETKEKLSNFKVQTISCDATGVGEPLVDRLTMELPFTTVIPVKFTSQSKDHLYKFFLLMLHEHKCTWPGHNELRRRKYWQNFRHQMTNLVKEYKGEGKYLSCHAPEDQKNAHDDFPDSLALMLWCICEEAMPFIDVSEDTLYTGQNWNQMYPGAKSVLRG